MDGKAIFQIIIATCFVGIWGCASTAPDAKSIFGGDTAAAQTAVYAGPKAKITIAEIEEKSSTPAGGQPQYGQEIHSMLLNGLVDSGRYIVVDSSIRENWPNNGQGKKRLQKADLLVKVSVTALNPGSVDTTNQNVGGNNIIKSISLSQANIAIHVRVVDLKTGTLLATRRIEGKGVGFGGQFKNSTEFTSLTGSPNGPMEKAVAGCVEQTLSFMNAKIPPAYFRYRG